MDKTRAARLLAIKKWLKKHVMEITDLGFDDFVKTMDDLDDDMISGIEDDMEEEKARDRWSGQ